MKSPLTFVFGALLWAIPQSGRSQAWQNEKLIYLQADGSPAKSKKKAVAVEQIIPIADTIWEFNFYRMYGPRIKSFRSNDPDGHLLHGTYISYNPDGLRDTIGNYKNGLRSGPWVIYSGRGRSTGTQFWEDGRLLWTKDTLQLKHEQDSLLAANKKESSQVFTKVEIESEFPGGPAAWLRYLNHTLRYPDDEVEKNIQGQVIIGFIVDKIGHIQSTSLWVDQSVDLGIDEESMRVILSSGSWVPAIQNGRQVKSYKKQPIIYKLLAR